MKVKNKTNFDEEIKEINIKIQEIMKELDYIKKASEILTSETRKTLAISYM